MRPPPLYLQLKDLLIQELTSGRLKPGSRLPTETELMRLHKVSRITVRRTLELLQQEGLIVRFPRRGTFAARRPRGVAWTASSIEDVLLVGAETVPTWIEWREVRSVSAAGRLRLDRAAALYRLRSIREHRGIPLYALEAYVGGEIGRRLKRRELEGAMLIDVIEDRLDIPITSGLEEISACQADESLARRLNIAVGHPLLVLELVYFGADGRPIEYAKAWYRADMFRRRNLLARKPAPPLPLHAPGGSETALPPSGGTREQAEQEL